MEPAIRFRLTETIYMKQLQYYYRNIALIHIYYFNQNEVL